MRRRRSARTLVFCTAALLATLSGSWSARTDSTAAPLTDLVVPGTLLQDTHGDEAGTRAAAEWLAGRSPHVRDPGGTLLDTVAADLRSFLNGASIRDALDRGRGDGGGGAGLGGGYLRDGQPVITGIDEDGQRDSADHDSRAAAADAHALGGGADHEPVARINR